MVIRQQIVNIQRDGRHLQKCMHIQARFVKAIQEGAYSDLDNPTETV